MKTSEQINELAAALALAQRQIKNAVLDAKNPHYKSDYATLESVRAAILEPMAQNGLSIIQLPSMSNSKVALTTRLLHKSGQWVEDTCELLIEKPTMQGLGSALTYMRRYAISALTGLGEKDDDGNAAEKDSANAVNAKVLRPNVSPAPIQPGFKDPVVGQTGEYTVPFGKWKDSTLNSIAAAHGLEEMKGYVIYLEKLDNKPYYEEFIAQATSYIISFENEQNEVDRLWP
jgi:hypothetical protein